MPQAPTDDTTLIPTDARPITGQPAVLGNAPHRNDLSTSNTAAPDAVIIPARRLPNFTDRRLVVPDGPAADGDRRAATGETRHISQWTIEWHGRDSDKMSSHKNEAFCVAIRLNAKTSFHH